MKTAKELLEKLNPILEQAGEVPDDCEEIDKNAFDEQDGEADDFAVIDDEQDDEITEGAHYNTKIKMLEASHHPTKVRLGLKATKRMLNEMLDMTHPSPNPADDESRKTLESAVKKIGGIMESLKMVSVKKRGGKKIDENR